jgi:hypothetical protein
VIETAAMAALAAGLAGVSTQASRVWGHGFGGIVSAFPLIVGPVLVLAAQRHDAAYAAQVARATLLGLVALSGFALMYGRSATRFGWVGSLVIAWAAAGALGTLAGRIEAGLLGALAAATLSIAVARAALPPARQGTVAGTLPGWELPARMALTALMIVSLTSAGERFGPMVAGSLAALPTLASVLAVFTHARHGRDALIMLLRGMLGGLAAFVTFCALIGLMVERAGVAPAFLLATAAAVLVQVVALRRDGEAGDRCPQRPRRERWVA